MNPYYGETLRALTEARGWDKIASTTDVDDVSLSASRQRAAKCDALYEQLVKQAAVSYPGVSRADSVVLFALDLRATHAALGTKLAGSIEAVSDAVMKLAAAVLVDDHLLELEVAAGASKEAAAGASKEAAAAQRRLGREFIADVIAGFLESAP